MDQRYRDGREIHVGDRVTYNKQRGKVVFVADRGEFAKGYEWKEHSSGVMIEFDNGARLLLEAADELLAFEQAHA
jgi:hypothetical protein